MGINIDKLKGIAVIHKNPAYGRGIVVNVDGRYLDIHFDSDGANQNTHRFEFVSSFMSDPPLLKAKNRESKRLIRQIREENSCENCGKFSLKLFRSYGRQVCGDCENSFFACETCKKVFLEKDCKICGHKYDFISGEFVIKNTYQCADCFNKTHSQCPDCKETFFNWELESSDLFGTLCYDCASKNYIQCDSCEIWMTRDQVAYENGGICFCSECKDKHIRTCLRCGTEFQIWDGNTKYCKECKLFVDYYEYIKALDLSVLRSKEIHMYYFKDSRTKKLMGRLQHYYEHLSNYTDDPEKDQSFDVLLLDTVLGKLVVMYILPKHFRKIINGACTLTKFKQDAYLALFDDKYPVEFVKEISADENLNVWKNPYGLEAHTEANENYGSRWEGGELVEEGDYFGETSTFFIIGYISKRNGN